MLDKVYWLRKSCTRDIVAIVSNNLLFTLLQISEERYIWHEEHEYYKYKNYHSHKGRNETYIYSKLVD